MDQIIAQAIGPDSSLLGRIIAIGVLAAIGLFYFMATSSLRNRRDSPEAQREQRESERRAEAIARQARRELAEEKQRRRDAEN